MRIISRTVWMLSWVSLLTDMASEMLYPIMPIYLKSIGFSIALIGILEGISEATAGLSKGYFGKLSDLSGKRVPFVRLGYTLSALSKPMMAFFIHPIWIFLTRATDRIGKGIRTGARDAILSEASTPENRARVFGFHRSMDTMGAVLGPAIAMVYLFLNPGDYTVLFFLAFIPGLLAVATTFLLRDKNVEPKINAPKTSFFSFVGYWHEAPSAYRQLAKGMLFFTMFNSSDVFLLMRAKESGLSDEMVIGIYIFYNLVYALFSYPAGLLADMIGLKRVYISGLIIFAMVYAGMGTTTNVYIILAMFFLYGMYAAATEGISKAWISLISHPKDTATAIGTYAGFQSICTMMASTLTGLVWQFWGASFALLTTSAATVMISIYFIFVRSPSIVKSKM